MLSGMATPRHVFLLGLALCLQVTLCSKPKASNACDKIYCQQPVTNIERKFRNGTVVRDKVHFDKIHTLIIFCGYGRSAHSLIAALLDAHPHVIVAKGGENALDGAVAAKLSKNKLKQLKTVGESQLDVHEWFRELLLRSMDRAARDERVAGYEYKVPNQYNGRFKPPLSVIGVEKGGGPVMTMLQHKEELTQFGTLLQRCCGLNVIYLHCLRSPFDIISTQVLRKIVHEGQSQDALRPHHNAHYAGVDYTSKPSGALQREFEAAERVAEHYYGNKFDANHTGLGAGANPNAVWKGAQKVPFLDVLMRPQWAYFRERFEAIKNFAGSKKHPNSAKVLHLYSEDLLAKPFAELSRWALELNINADWRWINASHSVLFTEPHLSRNNIDWDLSFIREMNNYLKGEPLLARYVWKDSLKEAKNPKQGKNKKRRK